MTINIKDIPFPNNYKKLLEKGLKNTTIRIGNEVGKYKRGKIYNVTSYSQTDWKIKIKVNKVVKINMSDLSKFNIPKQTINRIIREIRDKKIKSSGKVELIEFQTL